ncbi:hypothetical protein FZC33_14165 [Labrys sp. KNU-23]|uniref:hypothetical protein n=1 Tax=Labrys sp. KNU-23 TaxID=2789216 RepID=UPI0011ECD836|nr:hypothetical protein [Labrys sp. KNU-23]QEN87401.1 hypothetical protein FZC33_14165 [Labrys sp. KNU-23]
MTTSPLSAARPSEGPAPRQGSPREQLQHLYRAIGISAVAAAAAQVARVVAKPDKPKHEMPACLRDEDDDLAA